MGIHHVAVLLGEDVTEVLPCMAHEGCVTVLMLLVCPQSVAQPFRDGYGADTAFGLWRLFQGFLILWLVDTALDR